MNITIRHWTLADLPTVQRVLLETWLDAYGSFIEKGAVVVGVSPDESGSHARFKAKYGLPFVLLADPEHRALEAYGVWAEKSMYGRKYMGVVRSTYVIGEDGVILKAFPKVSPEGHAVEILAAL